MKKILLVAFCVVLTSCAHKENKPVEVLKYECYDQAPSEKDSKEIKTVTPPVKRLINDKN